MGNKKLGLDYFLAEKQISVGWRGLTGQKKFM